MDVSVHRVINAPHGRVREYVIDPRNDSDWRKNTSSTEHRAGTIGAVGSRFEQVVMAMGNPTTVEITLLAASDEQLHFRGEGGMMPVDVRFDIKPVDGAADTATELTLTLSLDIPPAMAKMASRMIEAENDKDLARLAEILEG
jgi:carbon monoxide dehydrogenase subunit G